MARTVIAGGTVVDGTGAAPVRADVAVEGDRIVEVGPELRGADTVDASGRVVAPGFLDVHTHYDAQLCWDRLATPSMEHGVTTVVIGNCSLSLAPVSRAGRGKLVAMFEQIEDIRASDFEAGVPWGWEETPEYLRFLADGLGPNVAALVGHSTLRHHVMGAASQERAATPAEVDTLCALLARAVRGGACGISFSWLDVDEHLRPAPSRLAAPPERLALARALRAAGGRIIQGVPNFMDLSQQVHALAELAAISRDADITVTFGPVIDVPQVPALLRDTLATMDAENALGARLRGQTCPRPFDLNLRLDAASFVLFVLPGWMEVMRLPLPNRMAAMNDPAVRTRLIFEGMLIAPLLEYAVMGEVHSEVNAPLAGRRLADVARERNQMISQTLLEIALADGLRTEFRIVGAWHADEAVVARLMERPGMLVGVSDAGAHYAQFCGAGDTTLLLERFVRQRGDFTLERAVELVTSRPADAFGIAGRGRVRAGNFADLVLLDPATVARGPEEQAHDLPGGRARYVHHARGLDDVMVNGRWVIRQGTYTQERPGRVV